MGILGGSTTAAARVGRTKANALTVDVRGGDGAQLGHAKQKGSAGVLFGFKNGGRSSYTFTAGGDELGLDVAATTTISRAGKAIGQIAPDDGGCRVEDSLGALLARIRPHTGVKGDDPWVHPVLDPGGAELGTLKLFRSHTTMGQLITELVLWDVATSLKAPTAGSVLELRNPVDATLGDLLVAACVDFCVLPRGYVA